MILGWGPERHPIPRHTAEKALMQSANLEYDDVYQQLSVRLIQTIAEFDPAKGMLKQHIFAQLRYELLDCCTPYYRYGMTGLPCNFQGEFVPMEGVQEDFIFYEKLVA